MAELTKTITRKIADDFTSEGTQFTLSRRPGADGSLAWLFQAIAPQKDDQGNGVGFFHSPYVELSAAVTAGAVTNAELIAMRATIGKLLKYAAQADGHA